LSGLFNARSWTGLVRALAAKPVTRRLVPVGALTVVVVVGSVVGGAVLGFRESGDAAAREATKGYPPRLSSQAGEAVLVVSGYGSRWDGTPSPPLAASLTEERFSYRGLGQNGEPLAYTSTDTAKPLAVLDRMLLAQIASLHRRTGLRVAVVAESEGALIAKTALLADREPGVVALVMASPLESPGRVWYPTSSAQGWGVASSEAMRLMGDAFQDVAPIDLSPDNAFVASLDGEAPVLQNAMSCPLPGIKQAALLPLADATVTPTTEKLPFPAVVVPAFHGGVIESPEGEKVVRDILEGRPVTSGSLLTLADTVISYAATAWQVPALAPSDYPDGQHLPKGGGLSCRQIAAQLRLAVVR